MLVTSIYTKEVQAQHDYCIKHLNALEIPHKFVKKNFDSFEGDGTYQTPKFIEACYQKQLFALETIKKHNPGDLLLFSDLDVVAFQHYDKLKRYVDKHDICFMKENDDTPHVNCGFVLVKCTSRSIDFYEKWHEVLKNNKDNGNPQDDQIVLNWFLFLKNCTEGKHYRDMLCYFPRNIIVKHPNEVTINAVAYHAIGCTGNDKKIERMENALSKFSECAK